MTIADNVAQLEQRIALAAQRAGRDPAEITLVAVSKTHGPDKIADAAQAGLRDFGENRVEEALPKIAAAPAPGARWHMIGHIQSRKAKDVIGAGFTLIHSVDSLRLLEAVAAVLRDKWGMRLALVFGVGAFVAGASILGNGKVVLILDAAAVFKKAVDEEKRKKRVSV